MDPQYLDLLICPKTKGSLRAATAAELDLVNERIASGAIVIPELAAGEQGGAVLKAGLTCPAADLFYPVRDGIPVLLVEAAIPLGEAAAAPPDGPAAGAGH